MKLDLHREVMQRLEPFGFKLTQGWLRRGLCPVCRKKELYTNADKPWVLRCGRLNNCGWEGHVKELFSDIFDHWSKRYEVELKTNPQAAADAYLQHARGFDLSLIKGSYTQEQYFDRNKNIGSATVRFAIGDTWWERLIDEPSRFDKKARFQTGGSYLGQWWIAPYLPLENVTELWLVEGIFDAIALAYVGIHAVALMSCNNYPGAALRALKDARSDSLPTLVWALDGDVAGRTYTHKHVKRARDEGWQCKAASIPQTEKKLNATGTIYTC